VKQENGSCLVCGVFVVVQVVSLCWSHGLYTGTLYLYMHLYCVYQVVSLCWSHGLYTGILYVYNRALNDYTTPLEQLLAVLHSTIATGKQLTYQQVNCSPTNRYTTHVPTGKLLAYQQVNSSHANR